jgi:hypothetical protein
MRESHPRDALPRAGRFELSQVPISQPVRAFSRHGTLSPPSNHTADRWTRV